jgi:hypothetical protein
MNITGIFVFISVATMEFAGAGCSSKKTVSRSERLMDFSTIALSISDRMMESPEWLPATWEDIPYIKDMAQPKTVEYYNFFQKRHINELALVPGAPPLPGDMRLGDVIEGRLFAITRKNSMDYTTPDPSKDLSEQGIRYALLIPPEGKSMWATTIPEEKAKRILERLHFDPTKEPVAFPTLEEDKRKFEAQREAGKRDDLDMIERKNRAARSSNANGSKQPPEQTRPEESGGIARWVWVAIIALLGAVIAVVLRKAMGTKA